MRYFREPSSVRSYPSVHLAFIEERAQYTRSLTRRKSSAREAHLTGALGHGRFDAGAKMTDKRREWRSLVVCSWEIMHRLAAARAAQIPVDYAVAKCQGFEWFAERNE